VCGTGIWTLGFTLDRKALYHLNHTASPQTCFCTTRSTYVHVSIGVYQLYLDFYFILFDFFFEVQSNRVSLGKERKDSYVKGAGEQSKPYFILFES
jgi:hypothetical protein